MKRLILEYICIMLRAIVHFSVFLALLLVFACKESPSNAYPSIPINNAYGNSSDSILSDADITSTTNISDGSQDKKGTASIENVNIRLRDADSIYSKIEGEFVAAKKEGNFETAYYLLLDLINRRKAFKAWDYYQLMGLCIERDLSGNSIISHDEILDAARYFEEALLKHSDSDTLHFAMAQYLFGLMTLEESISHPYGTGQAIGERARESLKNARSYGAKPSECYYAEGNIYRFQNNFLDAVNAYRLSVDADPSFIIAYEAGYNVSMELGYPDQAASWLKEGIEDNPSNYELVDLLAYHLLSEAKQQEAVDVMASYLKRNAQPSKEALYDYGFFLEKNEQTKQATAYYLKAIEADSLNLHAYYRLGKLYENSLEWKQAYETFSKLLKHLPLNHAYQKEIRTTLEIIERKL